MATYSAGGQHFYAPRTLDELAQVRAAHPAALLLAGSTDIGLWVTKQLREIGDIIYLGHVDALKAISEADGMIEIGAGATLDDAYRAVCRHYPGQLSEMWQRFASLPIRNAGTLGGNVANGSPIGDSMPWLIALGAELVLRGPGGVRTMPLEDFYLGYQKKDLRPDEFVAGGARADCRAPACSSAPTSWPSASTRIFRRCARRSPSASTATSCLMRASRSAAWRRRRSARPRTEALLAGRQLERSHTAARRWPCWRRITRRCRTCAPRAPTA